MNTFLAIFISLSLLPAVGSAAVIISDQTGSGKSPVRASKQLSLLELEIGQLIMPSADISHIKHFKGAVERGEIGGILLHWGKFDPKTTTETTALLQSWALKSPLKLPLIIAADYEGGPVFAPETLGLPDLPTNMMMGASGSEHDCALLFYLAGKELKKAGINMNFAPVLDINTEPENPIIGVRSFGDNAQATARLGAAVIDGLSAAGVAPVVKHFPGHGASNADSHEVIPSIELSSAALAEHILPFERVASSAPAMMTAHVFYPALDAHNIATFSPAIIKGILRDKILFTGLIISDSLDMKAASASSGVPKAAVRALNAGVNMILIGDTSYAKTRKEIRRAVKYGGLPRQAVDEGFRLVKQIKGKYGATPHESPAALDVTETYQDVSRKIAREAVTVVRSSSGTIPFVAQSSGTAVCAVFFSPVRFSEDLSQFAAPLEANGCNVKISYLHAEPGHGDEAEALECSAGADLTVIGSFQWAGKPVLAQVELVKKLLESAKNPVLVSLLNPYDISLYPEAKTVIALYGVTKISAAALGEVIAGKITAQGKLPVRLPLQP